MQWLVRSQDGKLIIPIESVEAVTVSGKHIVRGGGRVLGEYATEERSIEVITDMMNFINALDKLVLVSKDNVFDENLKMDICSDENIYYRAWGVAGVHEQDAHVIPFHANSVYKMPKE